MNAKVPPQVIDLEKAVLGAILIEKDAFDKVSEILRADAFYLNAHQTIYSHIAALSFANQPIDTLTVVDSLKRASELESVGGAFFVTQLTNSVVSSAHIINHARKLAECFLLRRLIAIGGTLYANGFKEGSDPFELIEGVEKELHELTALNQQAFTSLDDTMIKVVRSIEELRHRDHHLTGISTGFQTLDKQTCGWQKTDLIILAARPKCGKTAMALNWATNAALSGSGVGFFSMEMSAEQLTKRILSDKSSMYLQSLRDARLDEEQMKHLYKEGIQKMAGLPFYIDDTAALSVSDLKSKARKMIAKGVKLIIVDYLQLMQPDKSKKNQNREQEISGIARQLKIVAKELRVPVIALSQLSREAEGKEPQLNHLRESGAIEQDADMVMFLYKPDAEDIRRIVLKIAAFRNGDVASMEFDFNGAYQRFTDRGVYNQKALGKSDADAFPGSWKPVASIKEPANNEDPF